MRTATHRITPIAPSAHGSAAPGSAAVVCAIRAIHADGSQAIRTNSSPSAGAHGSVRHARQPSTVATGAAGSASRFAPTPYTGMVGVSSRRMGWHASWAAAGTAIARATPRGSHRENRRASGPASRSSPAVAATESANP